MPENKDSLSKLLVRYYDAQDEEALSKFFTHFKDLAFHIAYNILGNVADAEDITQQVFIQILKKKAICKAAYEDSDSKVKSWLLSIVYNASRMQYKVQKRKKTVEIHEGANVESLQKTPDDSVKEDELLSQVNQAIFHLPEKYKVPILMRYQQNLSIEEISQILAAQPSTIRSILSRGISLLREKFEREKTMLSAPAMIEIIARINYPKTTLDVSLQTLKKARHANHHVLRAVKQQQSTGWFFKLVIGLTTVAAIGVITSVYRNQNLDTPSTIKQPSLSQKIAQTTATQPIKSTWDFQQDNASDLITIQGGIEYNAEKKYLTNTAIEPHTSAVAVLPYKITKPLKITVHSTIVVPDKNFDNTFNSLEFLPVKKQKGISSSERLYYQVLALPKQQASPAVFNFYIYNKQCITFLNGQINKIHQFKELDQESYVSLIIANNLVKKITIETLEASEQETIQTQANSLLRK